MYIPSERCLFHATVHTGFLEGFQGSGLGMGKTGLDAALGKRPTSATSLHQQKLNAVGPYAVTHGRDLLAFFQAAKVCQAKKFCRRQLRRGAGAKNLPLAARYAHAHGSRVHDGSRFWLEPSVVRAGSGIFVRTCAPNYEAVFVTLIRG